MNRAATAVERWAAARQERERTAPELRASRIAARRSLSASPAASPARKWHPDQSASVPHAALSFGLPPPKVGGVAAEAAFARAASQERDHLRRLPVDLGASQHVHICPCVLAECSGRGVPIHVVHNIVDDLNWRAP